MKTLLPIFLIVLVLGAQGCRKADNGQLPPENVSQKQQSAKEAFGENTKPLTAGEYESAAKTLFEQVKRESSGRRDYVKFIDIERMLRALPNDPAYAKFLNSDRDFAVAVKAMKSGFAAQNGLGATFGWENYEIRMVKPIEGRREAVVYSRVVVDGVNAKLRWWIIEKSEGWQFYDWENLGTGWRVSRLMGTGMAATLGGAPWTRRFTEITRADGLIQSGDYETAERLLVSLADAKFPADIEAVRLTDLATARRLLGKYEQALKDYDAAASINDDLLLVHLGRAHTLNGLERYKEALASVGRYAELLGTDNDTWEATGDAYAGLKEPVKAAEAYGKSLDDMPDSTRVLCKLGLWLDSTKKAEIGPRFLKLADPTGGFDIVAGYFLQESEFAALKELNAAFATLVPNSVDLRFYQARVLMYEGKAAEAAPMLEKALPRAKPGERHFYVESWADALCEAGEAKVAYEKMQPAMHKSELPLAFIRIVPWLEAPEQAEALKKTVDAHAKACPTDSWLGFYQGLLHEHAKQFDEAEKLYEKGFKISDEDSKDSWRTARIRNLVNAGKAAKAYSECGTPEDTFWAVISHCDKTESQNQLEEVLKLHKKARPKDNDLHLWQGELHFLRKEPEAAIVEFTAYEKGLAKDADCDWRLADRRARLYARLGKVEEAVAAAKSADPGLNSTLAAAVVLGAQGKDAELAKLLERFVTEWEDDPQIFYEDLDISPCLKRPGLKAFTDKYPAKKPVNPAKEGK